MFQLHFPEPDAVITEGELEVLPKFDVRNQGVCPPHLVEKTPVTVNSEWHLVIVEQGDEGPAGNGRNMYLLSGDNW